MTCFSRAGLSRVGLACALLASGVVLAPLPAGAQDYPARDIRAISAFPANTDADLLVRYYSEKLSALANRPVTVDNKAGSNGVVGTEAAAKAKADGYTILIVPGNATLAAAPSLYKKPRFKAKDFAGVTTLTKVGQVVLVSANSPHKSLADLTAQLKTKGDRGSYGAVSNAALIAAELYKKQAGLRTNKVRFREMQTPLHDIDSGNIDFFVTDPDVAIEQTKSGKLRALAVTSAQRLTALPDAPTMAEAGLKDYGEMVTWWGVFVPAKTPPAVVEKLERWFNQIANSDETKAFLAKQGSVPFVGSAKSLAALIAGDATKWAEYVKLAGIDKQ